MLVVLLHARFSVVGPIPFLLAAIFFSVHPYIGSTTVLPDISNYFRIKFVLLYINWNAGMGYRDTLHSNSCFCCFSTKNILA